MSVKPVRFVYQPLLQGKFNVVTLLCCISCQDCRFKTGANTIGIISLLIDIVSVHNGSHLLSVSSVMASFKHVKLFLSVRKKW